MPEVIEVKQYTDFFNKNIKNHKITDIKLVSGRYVKHGPFKGYNELLDELPIKIIDIKSKGKFMYMKLSNDKYIGFTLGLSGGWFYKNNKGVLLHGIDTSRYMNDFDIKKYQETALKHIKVEIKIDKGIIYFYDQLSFGTITVMTESEINIKLNTLGIDFMDNTTIVDDFKNKLLRSTNQDKPIGNVLMNQKLFSGIGNYLRADILWLSKINPFRKVNTLSDNDISTIYKNINILIWMFYDLKTGIKNGIIPKTLKTPWDYNRDFYIYMQKTDIYNNKVIKEKLYEGSQVRYIYWTKEQQI